MRSTPTPHPPAVAVDVRATTNGAPQNYGQNANAQWVLTNAANNNQFVDPMLTSLSRTNDPAYRLDPRPKAGSPALTSALTAPDDGFYTPVSYKGAFEANDLWIDRSPARHCSPPQHPVMDCSPTMSVNHCVRSISPVLAGSSS